MKKKGDPLRGTHKEKETETSVPSVVVVMITERHRAEGRTEASREKKSPLRRNAIPFEHDEEDNSTRTSTTKNNRKERRTQKKPGDKKINMQRLVSIYLSERVCSIACWYLLTWVSPECR